jgi:hypothetical protein
MGRRGRETLRVDEGSVRNGTDAVDRRGQKKFEVANAAVNFPPLVERRIIISTTKERRPPLNTPHRWIKATSCSYFTDSD